MILEKENDWRRNSVYWSCTDLNSQFTEKLLGHWFAAHEYFQLITPKHFIMARVEDMRIFKAPHSYILNTNMTTKIKPLFYI
jgi:hypothetical protein